MRLIIIIFLWLLFIAAVITFPLSNTLSAAESTHYSLRYDTSEVAQVAIIIPGMKQKVSQAEYQEIGGYYKSKGITPVFVDINWDETGIKNLAATARQISAEVNKSFAGSKIYIFGFSFGAVIAYKLAEIINPEQTLLCSMSPVFKEDREHQIFPIKQFAQLASYFWDTDISFAGNNGRCFTFLYGDDDSFLINNSIIENRKTQFKCNKSEIIKEASHDISKPVYLRAIKNIITGK